MNFEVERKFRVADVERVVARLAEFVSSFADAELQVDRYYAHPARDFAQTDEALRIRQTGSQFVVTYKGPKVDATTKTRRELELPLVGQPAAAGQYGELFEALGFRPVAEVRKQRRRAELDWQGRLVEVALDDVDGVGSFVELETTATDERALDDARKCLADLAITLGLDQDERRSYLEMLLAARAAASAKRS